MLTTIFCSRGSDMRVRRGRASWPAPGRTSFWYRSSSRGVGGGLAGGGFFGGGFFSCVFLAMISLLCRRSPFDCGYVVLLASRALRGGGDHAERRRRTSCSSVPCCRRREARTPMRVGLPHAVQTSSTFEIVDRHLLRQPAALRVLLAAASRACRRGSRLRRRPCSSSRSTLQHLAALAAVVAGDHFHDVVRLRMCITPPRWRG